MEAMSAELVDGDRSAGFRRVLVAVTAAAVLGLAGHYTAKVLDNGSAIVRWRPLLERLVRGEDVYHDGEYPNPPLLGICLFPLTLLPVPVSALAWFFGKVAMAAATLRWSIQLARGHGAKVPLWAAAVVLLLSLRPFMGDLQHGNVNLLICFLVVVGLRAFANGRDAYAGFAIALATAFKVTPALFLTYFAYKREWRVVVWLLIGLVVFLAVLPGLVVGPVRNLELLRAWVDVMIEPYLLHGRVETEQVNQSLPGFVYRLCTDSPGLSLAGDNAMAVNAVDLDPAAAGWIVRLCVLAVLGCLAYFCRTPTGDRRDWRLVCEWGLVLIAMLMISERSWKHHYVTMVVPNAVLVAHGVLRADRRARQWIVAALSAAMLLMMSTSSELGGWLARGNGHKYAQAYGMFLMSAVVSFVALSAILKQNSAPRDK